MKKQEKSIDEVSTNSLVYSHRRISDGEIFYIGIARNQKRPYTKRDRSDIWNKYVNKYEYEVEILHENITWQEACKFEKNYISLYGRRDLKTGRLLNMTDGGDGAVNSLHHWSLDVGKKEQVRAKISEANIGKPSPFKGKSHSEEAKQVNREKHIGKAPGNKGKPSPYKGIPRPSHSISMRGEGNSNSKRVYEEATGILYNTVQAYMEIRKIKNYYQLSKLINTNQIKVIK